MLLAHNQKGTASKETATNSSSKLGRKPQRKCFGPIFAKIDPDSPKFGRCRPALDPEQESSNAGHMRRTITIHVYTCMRIHMYVYISMHMSMDISS